MTMMTNIIFFSAQGISYTEGEETNWLENVNAGMTISPGGLPPQNCCGAILLLLLLLLLFYPRYLFPKEV